MYAPSKATRAHFVRQGWLTKWPLSASLVSVMLWWLVVEFVWICVWPLYNLHHVFTYIKQWLQWCRIFSKKYNITWWPWSLTWITSQFFEFKDATLFFFDIFIIVQLLEQFVEPFFVERRSLLQRLQKIILAWVGGFVLCKFNLYSS